MPALLCASVAASLGLAAAAKLRAPMDFLSALAAYRLLPDVLLTPVARLLPLLEAAGAFLLLLVLAGVGAALLPGLLLSAGLLLMFAGAMAINLLRGRTGLSCGCGGREQPIGWGLVAQNGAVAGLLLLALLLPAGMAPSALSAGERLAALIAGLSLTMILRALRLLMAVPSARLQPGDR